MILPIVAFILFFIMIVSAGDNIDYDYFLLLMQKHKVQEARYTIQKIYTGSTTSNSGGSSGSTSATDGSGLNLMLIDELQEGYVKEMLSMFKDSYNGTYDSAAFQYHLPVDALCGLQNAESGMYAGTSLLQSYLPISNGNVIWNQAYNGASASEMTLAKFDEGVKNKLGGAANTSFDTGAVTVFQYDNWSSTSVKSSVSGATNGGRASADHYFLPDILNSNNNILNSLIKDTLKLGSKSQSDFENDWLSFMYAGAHNRGSAGFTRYIMGFYFYSSAPFTLNNVSADEILEITNSCYGLVKDYKTQYLSNASILSEDISSQTATYVAVNLAIHDPNWFISEQAYGYLASSASTCMDLYNKMFPNEAVGSTEAWLSLARDNISTYPEAIKAVTGTQITTADSQAAYQCTTTPRCTYSCGYIFGVMNKRSSIYDNKYTDGSQPYVVHCLDLICAREVVSASMFGGQVYARMLTYAGLNNVDRSNPNTYYTTNTVRGSFKPIINETWYSSFDVGELSKQQRDILNTGYNLVRNNGCVYDNEDVDLIAKEFTNSSNPTKMDSVTFMYRVLKDAGYPVTERLSAEDLIQGRDDYFDTVDAEQVEAGDIIIKYNEDGTSSFAILISSVGNTYFVLNCTSQPDLTGKSSGAGIRQYNKAIFSIAESNDESKAGTYFLRIKNRDSVNTIECNYE